MTNTMPFRAIVPVKRFSEAKTRLSPLLSPHERILLAQAMLQDVLAALAGTPRLESITVATGDADAVAIADHYGAKAIDDAASPGLNAVVTKAYANVSADGTGGALIVPADIPLLSPDDVEEAMSLTQIHRVVLAPAQRDGGTNLLAWLASSDAIAPQFGPDSLQLHLAATRRNGLAAHILKNPAIGLDIDLPADVATLLAHGGSNKTINLLRKLDVPRRIDAIAPSADAASEFARYTAISA